MIRPDGRPASRWQHVVATALVALAALMLMPADTAAAHNTLDATDPAANSTVARTPASIKFVFNEPALALGTRIVVIGPSGEVQQGAAQLVDNTITQPLQPGSPAGAYTVEWRVTSADGHPVSGQFGFVAREAGQEGTKPDSTSAASPAAAPVVASTRSGWWLGLAGIVVLAVGATGLAAGLRSRRARKGQRSGMDPSPGSDTGSDPED